MLLGLFLLQAFEAPKIVSVTPSSYAEAKEPQVAIDPDGATYIVFGKGNALFVSRSRDQGRTFEEPVKIGEPGKLSLGMRRGPRITAYEGTVTVTSVYGSKGKGQDGEIVSFRSTNGGKTWSAPVAINDVAGSAREGLHGMAASPQGKIAAVWLDLRAKGTQLYYSESANGGLSWSKNSLVYQSPDGTICECCHPSIVFDRKGNPHVMFRNSLSGARDMYLTNSLDGGKSFAPARKLGEETWMLNACPMDGGMLALDQNDEVFTFWRRNNTMFECRPGRAETTAGQGQQGWIASGPDGMYRVWQVGRTISLATPQTQSTVSKLGTSPVVASSPDRQLVIAAWADAGIKAVVIKSNR